MSPSRIDDDKLRQMWCDDLHNSVIAQTMGVTEQSIRRRARVLALPERDRSRTAATRVIVPVAPRPAPVAPPKPKPISGYDRIAQIAAERNIPLIAATQHYHRERANA